MGTFGPDYARAMLPPSPGAILGVRLRTYCIGHELLLQRHGSPFAAESESATDGPAEAAKNEAVEPGMGDLLFGLGICGRRFEEAREWAESRAALRWMRQEGARLSKMADAFIKHRVILFQDYVIAGWKYPKFGSPHGGGAEMGTPILASVLLTLRSAYGKGESEALNTPLRQALWEHLAYLESEGRIEIRTPMDPAKLAAALAKARELGARAKQMEALAAAKS